MNSAIQPESSTPAVEAVPAKRSRTRQRLLVILGIVVAIIVVAVASYFAFIPRVQPLTLPQIPANVSTADLGLENWQTYQKTIANPLQDPSLPAQPVVDQQLAAIQDAAGMALIKAGKLDQGLAYLKAAAEADPDNLRITNDYRLSLRDQKRYTDEEAFFSDLQKKHNTLNVSIHLALSYVDEMRSCPKPPDGLVCQAQFSTRSIDLLNTLLSQHEYNVIARYARGLNHLYWPRLMGHLAGSQADLQYSVALLPLLKGISTEFGDDAYTALGDVFGKDGKPDEAQNVWRNGIQVIPNSELLKSRLNIPHDQIEDQETGPIRGLGVYVETDIALFWT